MQKYAPLYVCIEGATLWELPQPPHFGTIVSPLFIDVCIIGWFQYAKE
jgi:hypothetical protein